MKNLTLKWAIMLFAGLFVACSSGLSEEELAILKEAAAVHDEAYAKQKEIDGLMVQLVEYRNFFMAGLANNNERESQVLDDVTTEDMKSILVEIQSIEESLLVWKEDFTEVEIPGEEHDHDHGDHDHGHSHAPAADITPAQMLDLQRGQKALIESIHERVLQVLERSKILKDAKTGAEL
jgi:hypothetical protein